MRLIRKIVKPVLNPILNRTHPMIRGLVAAWVLNEGGGRPRELITNYQADHLTGNPIWRPTGLSFDGSGDAFRFQSVGNINNMTTWSIVVCSTLNGTSASDSQYQRQFSKPDAAIGRIITGYSTDTNYWRVGNGASTTTMVSGVSVSMASLVGVRTTWAWVADGSLTAANQKLFRNGIRQTLTTTSNGSGTPIAFGTTMSIGGVTSTTRSCNETIHYIYVYNRQLSDKEVLDISNNPYQIFYQPSNLRDDAGPITYTSTAVLDSLVQKAYNQTSGLDALLQRSLTAGTSLGALLQKGYLTTTSLNAILQKAYGVNASLDSLLLKAFTQTTNLDAVLGSGGVLSLVFDALLSKSFTSTAGLNALLQKSFSGSSSLDGILVDSIEVTTLMNALLQDSFDRGVNLDAVIGTSSIPYKVYLGSAQLDKVYIGGVEVSKIYLGSTQI